MAINKLVKKKELRKFITIMNKSDLRISGWCKTYGDIKEFVSQKETCHSLYRNTEVSYHN